MRRPSRLAVLCVIVGALIAAGCAEISDEGLAAVEAATERRSDPAPTAATTATPNPSNSTGSASPGDEDETADGALAATLAPREGAPPEINQFRCPFDRDGIDAATRCGKIELPGRGSDEDYTIDLAFVRFSATGDAEDVRPDPVVYLHGGPGGAILDDAAYWYDSIVAPHIEHRDVILYDQRGGGRSTNLPICHEATSIGERFSAEAIPHEDLTDEFLVALDDCATKFRDLTTVDTTAFNSRVNAQDLVDLMWALGITEYNIHGSSYGTRLAQTVMRDAPEGVRSVILSGSYPIDANLMGSVSNSMESSLGAVFAGCAANDDCARALPDPWSVLESLVADLDADPMRIEVPTTADASASIRFDGTDFVNALHGLLYLGYDAAGVPDLLIDHLDGDDRRLRRLGLNSLFDVTDTATFLLVQCADESAFTTGDDLERPLEHEFLRAVDLAPSINGVDSLEICESWDTGPAHPTGNDPVTWDAPTLLLSGAVDPITPPEWARSLAANLPRSRLVVRAGASHDSDEGWCALGLIADFVQRPEVLVDASCAAGEANLRVDTLANRFRTPMEIVDTSLDLDGDGVHTTVRVPDWWADWGDDVHIRWRGLDNLDPTALIILDGEAAYDLVNHMPFSGPIPDWVEEPRSGVPSGWTRWTMRTTGGDLISYVRDQDDFEVALVLESGETEDLERTVLMPTATSIGER